MALRWEGGRMRTPIVELASLWLVFCLAASSPLGAAEKELGWADAAELSFVAASGNAEAQTLGFRNLLTHGWANARFSLEASGLRAETTTTAFVVVGEFPDFEVQERSTTTLTAESYLVRARYDRDLVASWFWFTGAGWERNQFAGFDDRWSAVAGAGRTWRDDDKTRLRTDLGLTFTREQVEVGNRAGRGSSSEEFLGARFSWDFKRALTKTTTYTNTLYLDGNFDDTDDLRADLTQAIAVSMTDRLALKASLQLLFDNQPGFLGVPIPDPGSGGDGRFLIEREDLDSVFTLALVYKVSQPKPGP